jgi:hypothetical protein
MAFLADAALDAGLQYVRDNGVDFYITSAEATTYTEATDTLALGSKTSVTIGAQADYAGAGAGRKVEVATFTDGTVSATGTATHWALVNPTGTVLVATGALSASQAVTNGNPLSLTAALPVAINDATAI